MNLKVIINVSNKESEELASFDYDYSKILLLINSDTIKINDKWYCYLFHNVNTTTDEIYMFVTDDRRHRDEYKLKGF